ncbi:MAG TPA: hypothetical protein VLR90_18050 [Blastocatellia bacterium]|nr:hypothetical protein [Blastocatellia bacterium]
MPQDRVDKLLHFYFKRPYVEYGEVILEIKENGGLTADEVRTIESQVLHIDAKTMIRQSGFCEGV